MNYAMSDTITSNSKKIMNHNVIIYQLGMILTYIKQHQLNQAKETKLYI